MILNDCFNICKYRNLQVSINLTELQTFLSAQEQCCFFFLHVSVSPEKNEKHINAADERTCSFVIFAVWELFF